MWSLEIGCILKGDYCRKIREGNKLPQWINRVKEKDSKRTAGKCPQGLKIRLIDVGGIKLHLIFSKKDPNNTKEFRILREPCERATRKIIDFVQIIRKYLRSSSLMFRRHSTKPFLRMLIFDINHIKLCKSREAEHFGHFLRVVN